MCMYRDLNDFDPMFDDRFEFLSLECLHVNIDIEC